MDTGQIASVVAVAIAWFLKTRTRLNNGLLPFIVFAGILLTRLGVELASPTAQAGIGSAAGGFLTAVFGAAWADSARAFAIHAITKGLGRLWKTRGAILVPYTGGASGPEAQARRG